jgi:hypothetical protein
LGDEAGAAEYMRRPITPELMGDASARCGDALARSAGGAWRPDRGRSGGGNERHHARDGANGGSPGAPPGAQDSIAVRAVRATSSACLELDELYHGFLLTAMGQLGLGAGVLYHLDVSGWRPLLEVVSRGIRAAEARRLLDFRAGLGAYLLAHAASGAPRARLLSARKCAAKSSACSEAGLAVACPMAAKGSPVGVALFGRASRRGFTADDLLLLSAVCNFAGPALDSARLYTELH